MIAEAGELWRTGLQAAAWAVAAAWVWKAYDVLRNMPQMPDLTDVAWDRQPGLASNGTAGATLTVVVPARDEEANIAATLDALMLADYSNLRVLVIDDRSSDKTGSIVDAYVAEYATKMPGRLEAIHITDLPEGWLGKTFALQVATENSDSEFLLYTDADVLFSPSVLRRAMVFVEREQADHVVVLPTPLAKSRGEGMVLGFLQILGMWAARPWRIADPKAEDAIGVGSFNLVRRAALEEIGGWTPQRLAILEDITLGRRMKLAGQRQRLAFAPGLVLVHWASGAPGLVRVMTKNLFSAFNFRPLLLLGAMGWMTVFFLAPLAELGWWPTLVPGLMVLCCVGACYRVMGETSRIDARYAWLYPAGAAVMLWAMLRSMAAAWWRGGVVWRGTHYALRDLQRHNSQFAWKRAAQEERLQARMRR